jgi:hypothetical protein
MPIKRALLARLIITVGALTMLVVHWLENGSSSMPFGLGALIVACGLALLPDWRNAWADAKAKPAPEKPE